MRLFAGTPFDRPPKCERCGELETECHCPPQASPREGGRQLTARLSLEKRRKGKIVTVIRGLGDGGLDELLSQLKTACGAGGTMKDGVLEIQGDHLGRIAEVLHSLGYRVKG